MYKELAASRPTKKITITKIWIDLNGKITPEELIHKLQELKSTGENNTWIEIGQTEDKYGNINSESINVCGIRPFTNKEWKEELNLSLVRGKKERERILSRAKYYEEEWGWYTTENLIKNRIKQINEEGSKNKNK